MLTDKDLLNGDLVFVGDLVTSEQDKIQAWIKGFGPAAAMKFELIKPDGSVAAFLPDINVNQLARLKMIAGLGMAIVGERERNRNAEMSDAEK